MGYTPLPQSHTHNKTCHTVRMSKKINVKTNLIKRKIVISE
jgi:hypothetical protein